VGVVRCVLFRISAPQDGSKVQQAMAELIKSTLSTELLNKKWAWARL
jgi:hypothetical protein